MENRPLNIFFGIIALACIILLGIAASDKSAELKALENRIEILKQIEQSDIDLNAKTLNSFESFQQKAVNVLSGREVTLLINDQYVVLSNNIIEGRHKIILYDVYDVKENCFRKCIQINYIYKRETPSKDELIEFIRKQE